MSTAGKPIVELIAQNILDTLKGISQLSGYQNDCEAERMLAAGNRLRDRLLIVHMGDAFVVNDDEPAPTGRIHWEQTYHIVALAQERRGSTLAIDTRIASLWADVQRAMSVDRSRGSYAIDTMLADVVVFHDDGFDGIEMSFNVKFRTLENDPYQQ